MYNYQTAGYPASLGFPPSVPPSHSLPLITRLHNFFRIIPRSICIYSCQIWSWYDGRVERGGGRKTNRHTKGHCSFIDVINFHRCVCGHCDNTYNLVQAERTFAASIIICQDAGIAIEKETVHLHLGTCDWCEDVFFLQR